MVLMATVGEASEPRELPIVGGHLALDFANTVDDPLGPARHDHLDSYAGLLAWAHRVELVDAGGVRRLAALGADRPRQAAAVLRRASELRDALNDVFGAVVEHRADLTPAWTALRPHVVRATDAARMVRADDGAPTLDWGHGALDSVLHEVASAGASLLLGPDTVHVKRCARCPWLFLDRSKNHSRRWCDMNDCGRAEKIERIQERRRRGR
jgi:predicted RNA-binding Zn ribbon-like protein